ncbi:PaaI family thioesterase [Aeromonas salmonicida]
MDRYQQAMRSHANCMVCGIDNQSALGIGFHQTGEHSTEGVFLTDERYQGYTGILHGGMTSTLLDAVMTHCLLQQGIKGLTAELTIRFVVPINIGSKIYLSAQIVDQGHGIHRLNAVALVDGVVVAKASAKFIEKKVNDRSFINEE